MKINDNEQKVLECLTDGGYEEGTAFYFRGIVSKTGLDLKQVRRYCHSLTKKGLAEYVRGLFDDDGMAAGSGYAATNEGYKFIRNSNEIQAQKM